MNLKKIDGWYDLSFWIAIPTIRLTEKNKLKAVRVIGFFAAVPLFPLTSVGGIILFFVMLVDVLNEI